MYLSLRRSLPVSVYFFLSLSLSFSFSLSLLSLSISLPIYLSVYLPTYLSISSISISISLPIYLSVWLAICLFLDLLLSLSLFFKSPSLSLSFSSSTVSPIHLSIDLSIHLSIYPFIRLSIFPSIYLSICLSQRKQFCKTSSKNGGGQLQNEKIREASFKNGKRSAELTASYQCVCDFSTPFIWSIAPATKKWGQAIQSAAFVTQNHLRKLDMWCSKLQPVSGNQRPDLLTCLTKMSLVLRLSRDLHFFLFCKSSSNVPRLPSFLKLLQSPHVWQGAESIAPAA